MHSRRLILNDNRKEMLDQDKLEEKKLGEFKFINKLNGRRRRRILSYRSVWL